MNRVTNRCIACNTLLPEQDDDYQFNDDLCSECSSAVEYTIEQDLNEEE